MNNAESRELAIKKYRAKDVKQFTQKAPVCAAYVAIWLRKRSLGEAMWNQGPQYFDKMALSDVLDAYLEHDDANKPLKGITKAIRMTEGFKAGGHLERQYVASGSTGKKSVLKFETTTDGSISSPKAKQAGNILWKKFLSLETDKRMASFGIFTTVPHAIGVDCSQAKSCVYFDPNLGELTFPEAGWLGAWWSECFADRQNVKAGLSAWKEICDSVWRADEYSRP
jgi:hypothetical protein